MAMDGFSVLALTDEINRVLSGSKIDKIQQTEHDELLISFFGACGGRKLRLTANPSVARVCLTEDKKKSPETAPLFCMLLRKHLAGAKLILASQPDFERIIVLSFEGTDEFGEKCEKRVYAELMGRHSNIILTDGENKIIDSIKRVDFSVSSVRQILPGLTYEAPPVQDKLNPLECDLNTACEALKNADGNEKIDKAVMNTFRGVSPLLAREICHKAFKTSDMFMGELGFSQILDLATSCIEVFKRAKEKMFSPCYLLRGDSKKPFEFCAFNIEQYGEACESVFGDSMSEIVESFYMERDKKERIAHKSARLVKTVSNNLERCAKKLSNQTAELDDTRNMEKYKQFGELITANMYRINKGEKNAVVENYYSENETVSIPLDEKLSPSENAQRYFKKYTKSKTAKNELTRQIEKTRAELSYLESVEEELQKAENEKDLAEISEELFEQGYIKRQEKDKRKREISNLWSL